MIFFSCGSAKLDLRPFALIFFFCMLEIDPGFRISTYFKQQTENSSNGENVPQIDKIIS